MKTGAPRIAILVGVVGLAAWVSAAPHATKPWLPRAAAREPVPPETTGVPSRPVRMPRAEPRPPAGPARTEEAQAGGSSLAITVRVVPDTIVAPPTRLALEAGVPNPFRTTTTIPFSLPRPANVSLRIYDMMGRQVATLVDGARPAGRHNVVWRATDDRGGVVNAGMYVCRLVADGATRTQKLILSP